MIGLSFDIELNRDIGVGYVGRKADTVFPRINAALRIVASLE